MGGISRAILAVVLGFRNTPARAVRRGGRLGLDCRVATKLDRSLCHARGVASESTTVAPREPAAQPRHAYREASDKMGGARRGSCIDAGMAVW
jgi:hypothetical protein